MDTTPQVAEIRRAYRDTAQPYLGGVAGGLARHLGLPVSWIRIFFALAATVGGFGVVLYAALWMVLPSDAGFVDPQAPGLESATRSGKRPGRVRRLTEAGPVIALGALGLGAILGVEATFGAGALFWPALIGVAGIALLWRQADEAQRERWLDTSGRVDPLRAVIGSGDWASYGRLGAGLGLVLIALGIFSLRSGSVAVARDVTVAGLLAIAGVGLVVGPWVYRLAGDLTAERAERLRTQDRADVAAHLHDSVLQTLALIQKNASDAPMVARLARAQERDLRAWLYADERRDESTLAAALRAAAAEIEDDHGISVDVINVGDCAFGEDIRPLVLAAREAITNAAKHAGVDRVDVYAETVGQAIDVFVRDRGAGFDQAAIGADRHGVRDSIIDRMERHGGSAVIRSAPGEGTEVRLHLDRTGPQEEES